MQRNYDLLLSCYSVCVMPLFNQSINDYVFKKMFFLRLPNTMTSRLIVWPTDTTWNRLFSLPTMNYIHYYYSTHSQILLVFIKLVIRILFCLVPGLVYLLVFCFAWDNPWAKFDYLLWWQSIGIIYKF